MTLWMRPARRVPQPASAPAPLRRCGCLTAAAVLVASFAATPAVHATPLAAGPMAGPAAMREASIWLQGRRADPVQLEYWPLAGGGPLRRTAPVRLAAADDYAATLRLTHLDPGTAYRYRLVLAGQRTPVFGTVRTAALWHGRAPAPDVRVLAGSCAYTNDAAYDRPGPPPGGGDAIFGAMAALNPDLTVWLGDNLYLRDADFSPFGMADRYRKSRAHRPLQHLLRTGQHAAIWDDHDYGPNDANSSWIHKAESLRLFRRYWPNPSAGLPEVPGIFTVVKTADVEFFLLDNRYHRDADRLLDEPGKSMLGPAQLRWLKNALLNSTAAFKVIVNGSQMLNPHNQFESWARFTEEQGEFLDWLERQKVPGILFLSGDRHHTELLVMRRARGYPLFELTCSPLTGGTRNVEREADKPNLVPGTLVGSRNFCALEFSGSPSDRRVTLSSRDAAGTSFWTKTVPLADLR